jgi:HEAT repeat protein
MSRNILSEMNLAMQAQGLPNLMTDAKYGRASEIMAMPASKLVAILQDSGASVYARAKACQRLAVVGDRSAVPALAALLDDAHLSNYARFALEPLPDAAADDALRGALEKVKGPLLVGVINSIGKRRDTRAIARLERLRHDQDGEVARAADAALARIRPTL